VSIEYIDLADYIAIATAITGLDLRTVMNITNLDLADSALHAPAADIGDTDFYPEFVDKAAVLVVRLARNHPLPDGNKRAAWVSLRLFVDLNDWTWVPTPEIDDAEAAVLAIAAGEWDEEDAATWLKQYLRPSTTID
jgi:death on curing protein